MSQELLMQAVSALLICLLLAHGIRALFTRSVPVPASGNTPSVQATLSWAIRDDEIRRRALVTVGLLLTLYAAFLIPLPGINRASLYTYFDRFTAHMTGIRNYAFLRLTGDMLIGQVIVFGNGLAPFLSACLIVQVAAAVVSPLRRWSFAGEIGRRRLEQCTYVLTGILACLQSWFLIRFLEFAGRTGAMPAIVEPHSYGSLLAMTTLMAGTFLLLAAAHAINQWGLGHGIAMIVLPGILLRLSGALYALVTGGTGTDLQVIIALAVMAMLAFVAWHVTRGAWQIALVSRNQTQRCLLPLRITWLGTVPLAWSSLLASSIALWLAQGASPLRFVTEWWGLLLKLVVMLIIIALYSPIVMSPSRAQRVAERYGYVSADSPTASLEQLLKRGMARGLFITGGFLAALSLVPMALRYAAGMPTIVSGIIGGTGIVIVIGVMADIVQQLMFFKQRCDSGIHDWSLCHIAADEIEAEMTHCYLQERGIPTLVEPLRFTWGMPMRTVVDQYRLYTPATHVQAGRDLLR